jgi:hypothetical protein
MSPKDKVASMGGNIDDVQGELSQHAVWVLTETKRIAKQLDLDPAFVVAYLEKKFPNPGAGLKAQQAITAPDAPPALTAQQ